MARLEAIEMGSNAFAFDSDTHTSCLTLHSGDRVTR